jgi:soluble lytic murein transglycosylase-like protein
VILLYLIGKSIATNGVEFKQPPIKLANPKAVKTITRLNRTLKPWEATTIAFYIEKYSKQYKIPPKLLLAIIAQESRFNSKAKSKTKDFGLTQINDRTIKNYGFNKELILADVAYAIECSAKILKDLKRSWFRKERDHYWTRYNSSDPVKRQQYKIAVYRFYNN